MSLPVLELNGDSAIVQCTPKVVPVAYTNETDDGTRIKRRSKIPDMDPTFYDRSLIYFNDDPSTKNGLKILKKDAVQFFTISDYIPKNFQKCKSNYPKLGEKKATIFEYNSEAEALNVLKLWRSNSHKGFCGLLGTVETKKKKGKKEKSLPVDFSSYRPRFILKNPNESAKQVKLIREPIGPPSEKSKGFSPGWRCPVSDVTQDKTIERLSSITNCLPPDPAILLM